MRSIRRAAASFVLLAALSLVVVAPAAAATHTWIGPSGGLWSNTANWSGGSKPTSGEPGGTIVQFGSNTTSTMDIAGLTVDQIHFTGANNTINGTQTLTINGATLTFNIVSEGAGNTLSASLPITLVGASTELSSSTGMLTLNSPIAGGVGLVFAGDGGSFALYDENTYTGVTAIDSGAVHISAPVGLVIEGSSIVVGNGFTSGAQLVLDQSSDISKETALVVNSGGTVEFDGHADSAKSLTVSGGAVVGANLTTTGELVITNGSISIAGWLFAGSLSMTGGTISSPGSGWLQLSGNIQASSSASGPAIVSSSLHLNASPTVNVTAGVAPELSLTGPISETGASRSINKTGAGTLLTGGTNTYTGTTTVSAGTLIANGTQPGALTVGASGTLSGSGTVGATLVDGVLAPIAPGLTTSSLSFGPTGKLQETLTSFASGMVPSAIATGIVAIEPAATLNLVVTPGTAAPHGSHAVLVEDRGEEPIIGHFSGFPSGLVLSSPEGVPLAVSYTGGDGNDLTLTAGNVAPQAGAIVVSPSSVRAGQPVTLSVSGSDANKDSLATTWSFGDGASGSGSSTSHVYSSPGSYPVVATVSDGLAQVQSATTVTVTPAPAPPQTTENTPPSTSTQVASAFGAEFALTVPRACTRAGSRVTVALSVKKPGKAKGHVLKKIEKVTFAIGRKTLKTVHSVPYRALLTIPRSSASGRTVKIRVIVHALVRGAGRSTKTFTVSVKVC
jgi:autotransporter-associated beta strand protein